MTTFMSDNDFINIIMSNTCFKTSTRTFIDLILTNKQKRFQITGVIVAGVHDHRLLIFTFLKTSFTKMPPNKCRYRKYKWFDKIRFLKDVSNLPEKANYTEEENHFLRVLNKHALLKSKVISGNSKHFVTKTLKKSIMQISTLKKKTNNLRDPLSIKLNKKQRNYVFNLRWQVKKDVFQKHMSHGSSSKKFWKFWKPFFTNKITNFDDKIMLVENKNVVSKKEEMAYLFNTCFNEITKDS